MRKKQFVYFGEFGARYSINKTPPKGHLFVQDPDLSSVDGIHPSEWALVDGNVVPKGPDFVGHSKSVQQTLKRFCPVFTHGAAVAFGIGVALLFR